jgi:hypothetical protein
VLYGHIWDEIKFASQRLVRDPSILVPVKVWPALNVGKSYGQTDDLTIARPFDTICKEHGSDIGDQSKELG